MRKVAAALGVLFIAWVFGPVLPLRGDQVEMQNGDRYAGKIVCITNDVVTLESEVLGKVNLPRGKVATISMGNGAANRNPARPASTNGLSQPPATLASQGAGNPSAPLKGLASSPNLIKQVEDQFLSDAGPEAKAKFNELLGGLMTGKLTVNDIRIQARSAADQLRSLKRELGPEAGDAMDGYLAILDKFLGETAEAGAATNAPAAKPKPRAAPAEEQ